MILENSNCDKTQIVPNLTIQIVTKLNNSNCDKTQKLKLCLIAKIKLWLKLKILNCDKTVELLKLKMWTKLKKKKRTWDETQKLKLYQTFLKNQLGTELIEILIVTTLKLGQKGDTVKQLPNSNCDETQNFTKLNIWPNLRISL